MPKKEVSRGAVRNIVGSVNTHNRVLEERECWKRRERELEDERRDDQDLRWLLDRKERQSKEDRTTRPPRGRDLDRKSRVQVGRRHVMEPSSASASDRWGHDGFLELYPENDESKPDDEDDGDNREADRPERSLSSVIESTGKDDRESCGKSSSVKRHHSPPIRLRREGYIERNFRGRYFSGRYFGDGTGNDPRDNHRYEVKRRNRSNVREERRRREPSPMDDVQDEKPTPKGSAERSRASRGCEENTERNDSKNDDGHPENIPLEKREVSQGRDGGKRKRDPSPKNDDKKDLMETPPAKKERPPSSRPRRSPGPSSREKHFTSRNPPDRHNSERRGRHAPPRTEYSRAPRVRRQRSPSPYRGSRVEGKGRSPIRLRHDTRRRPRSPIRSRHDIRRRSRSPIRPRHDTRRRSRSPIRSRHDTRRLRSKTGSRSPTRPRNSRRSSRTPSRSKSHQDQRRSTLLAVQNKEEQRKSQSNRRTSPPTKSSPATRSLSSSSLSSSSTVLSE